MSVRPRLKPITVHRGDAEVVLSVRALRRIHLADPTGGIAALLALLAEGTRDVSQLAVAIAEQGHRLATDELGHLLATLDEMGLLDRADADEEVSASVRARHESNLRFYDLFGTLERTSPAMQAAVAGSRVLLLGVGGLGSGILQSLVGLGVGHVTLVDVDVVEPKNLARQFTYGLAAIGQPKVTAAAEWVASYSTATDVTPINRRVADVGAIRTLGRDADLIVCAIDSPDDIHLLVNEASFDIGIPFVAGGLAYSTLSYWSVDPGRSPCRNCLELNRLADQRRLPPILQSTPLIEGRRGINRATGPVVQLISGLMAMEAMRYLSKFEQPFAAARYHVIELADRLAISTSAWPYNPACRFCGTGADAATPASACGRSPVSAG